jgi:U3 small nucleolar RNA-associated protein 3
MHRTNILSISQQPHFLAMPRPKASKRSSSGRKELPDERDVVAEEFLRGPKRGNLRMVDGEPKLQSRPPARPCEPTGRFADEAESENESWEDNEEAVMDLRAPVSDDDESEDDDGEEQPDDDDDDDDDEEEEAGEASDEDSEDDSSSDEDMLEAKALGRMVKQSTTKAAWGTNKAEYYEGGEGDDDDDAAAEEEEAALAQAQARAELLDEGDFEDAGLVSSMSLEGLLSAGGASDALEGSSSSWHAQNMNRVKRDAGALSHDEKLALLDAETPELRRLLADLADKAKSLSMTLQGVRDAQDKALPAQGVALLEARLQLMLLYMAHVSFFLMLRAEGAEARGHPVVRRLVRIRGLLERSRPLAARMKSRIDHSVAVARRAGQRDRTTDEAMLAPDLSALEVPQEAGEDGAGNSSSAAVFRPSKLAAMPYTGDDTAADKASREEAKQRRRMERSALLRELRHEASERPEEADMMGAEVMDEGDSGEEAGDGIARTRRRGEADDSRAALDRALDHRAEERRRFEEENFVRLNVSRDETKLRKQREKERGKFSALGELAGSADLLMRTMQEEDPQARVPSKATSSRGSDSWKRAAEEREAQAEGFERYAREVKRASKRGREEQEIGGGEDLDDEDDLYAAAERLAAKRKQSQRAERDSRREMHEEVAMSRVAEAAASGDKRKVTREILTNRGLTKYRKKELRNPRVANRLKAEKQRKKRKSAVPEMRREETAGYGGEATGIRSDISRSRLMR